MKDKLKRFFAPKRLPLIILCCVLIAALGLSAAKYISEFQVSSEAELKKYSVKTEDLITGEDFRWTVKLPATTRLFDDDEFASAAVVKKMRIINKGDDSLLLTVGLTEGISDDFHGTSTSGSNTDDICLYLSVNDPSSNLVATVQAAATGCDADSAPQRIRNSFRAQNEAALSALSGTLNVNSPKFLYIVIWRENSSDNSTTDFENDYYLLDHLSFRVSED